MKKSKSKIAKKHLDENRTGLPDNLKSGIENLSGHNIDDVKVHYNSSEPSQHNAHAYAQGTDIHLPSGQEKHLPHEAWHVVQQNQGRVKSTAKLNGKGDINDDVAIKKEADLMGAKALFLNKHSKKQRLTKLIANNNIGRLDCNTQSPIPIFGLNPLQGAYFVFSSNEWLNKNLTQITIQIIWEKGGLPKNFYSSYKEYSKSQNQYKNSSFKVNFKRLLMGNPYLLNEEPLCLYSWGEEDASIMPVSIFHLDLKKNIVSTKPENINKPFNIIKPIYWEGAIMIELVAPASGFGSEIYPHIYAQNISKNKKSTIPNIPYTPMVAEINVDMSYIIP